jgi:LmbE family N-acetylglucosaminyl deacetylase
MKKTFVKAALFLLCLLFFLPFVQADAAESEALPEAENISGFPRIQDISGFPSYRYFFDSKTKVGGESSKDAYFTLNHPNGIGSLYIIFQKAYGPYTITNNDTGEVRTVGENYFLHEFLDMTELFGSIPTTVTVAFPNGSVCINELVMYSEGQVPDTVQKWKKPVDGQTDLILFSTHGDDEQLFFAGVLPYYAGELGYQVQVVYLTDHHNNNLVRIHEMLNGLWAVGVDTYPVFGPFEDFWAGDKTHGYNKFKMLGWTEEHLLDFAVTQMRRFKPKVILAHDFRGEYGHGQHIVYADVVAKALELSPDPEKFPELADQYGVWDVPKAYFHLYKENEIVMDWDRPLERFGGETAYIVSIHRGFQCHASQIDDFAWYYSGAKNAMEVRLYNPCYYGLYRSTVGEDVEKNDFFENVTTYAEDARIAEEMRLEAERLAEEARKAEEARLAEEARKAEEAAKQALERQRAEEERIAQQARLEREAQAQQKKRMQILACSVCAMAILAGMSLKLLPEKYRKK